jgi:probable HAF family extracellular repeat protein
MIINTTKIRSLVCVLMLVLGFVLSVSGLAYAEYNFTTIDVPGSSGASCVGNSTHAISGEYYGGGDPFNGFVLSKGVFTWIDVPGAIGTGVYGISENGLLSGSYDDASSSHAFFRSKNGIVTTLDPPGSILSQGYKVNAQGQVVGYYWDPTNKRHGFIWTKGVYTTLTVPGDHHLNGTGAFGVNDRAQVVGWYTEENGQPRAGNRHGFLLSKGVYTTIDPPVPAPAFAAATGINNAGQIVGLYFDDDKNRHGFVLNKGIYTLIDVPGAIATDVFSINEKGEIVGSYDDADIPHTLIRFQEYSCS